MRVLVYNELNPDKIPNFAKVRALLEADNFTQADVKKVGDNLFRARLNKSDRLLFSLYRHDGETVCLLLEHIPNHAYERSRFLAGAAIDEAKIPAVVDPDEAAEAQQSLTYLHPERERFHLLDKAISLDEDQESVYTLSAPLVVVGSAGSGKTALILEKMKQALGDVLYVSLSSYLVRNARDLYYAHGYTNEDQEVAFLAFHELLETIAVPEGREVTVRDFQAWFDRHKGKTRLKDAQKVFEEIRGVITGPVGEAPWLSREQYLELGVKQSIFTEEERPEVYDLFEGYLRFLDEAGLFDPNILSHRYLDRAEPKYDFVVVDEVQDLTNIQLYLILRTLRYPGQFILGGDSNQIVHPNFFSWARVKSLFFRERDLTGAHEAIQILHTNYRNTPVVTEVANRILKLKHARFGSVDRESNFLVHSAVAEASGRLQLLADDAAVKNELDSRTARSARFAVLVMHPDQKPKAREWFNTPLVFSVQEAKGLEYDSIALFNFVSEEAGAFREIARDVDPAALEREELPYARARDKRDKSLEVYKFYINALYVAATRAVRNLYVIEADHDHPVMRLLQLDRFTGELAADEEASSIQEWQQEAHRLEMQGKEEQARDIRDRVLQQEATPWTPLDRAGFEALREQALAESNKKVRAEVFEYALVHYHLPTLNALAQAGFKPAAQGEAKALHHLNQQRFLSYTFRKPDAVLKEVDRYGVDFRDRFNLTPLMIGARLGNEPVVAALSERGADIEARANNGFRPVQFALEQAVFGAKGAREGIEAIHGRLVPDSLSVQVAGRLVKLDRRLMEHFLLLLMGALFYRHLGPAAARGGLGFTAPVLADYASRLPDGVLPERRKRREYISSVLAKNEVARADPYNRQLFVRTRRGHYVVNPALKVKVGEQWRDYYELFPPSDLGIPWDEKDLDPRKGPEDDPRKAALESRLREFRAHIDPAMASPAEEAAASGPEEDPDAPEPPTATAAPAREGTAGGASQGGKEGPADLTAFGWSEETIAWVEGFLMAVVTPPKASPAPLWMPKLLEAL
ncbi:MAG: AAA family ATPase, partial [Thiohalorhabdaceae bacterium]